MVRRPELCAFAQKRPQRQSRLKGDIGRAPFKGLGLVFDAEVDAQSGPQRQGGLLFGGC